MKTWLTVSLSIAALAAVTFGILAQRANSATGRVITGTDGTYVENSIHVDGTKSPKPQSLTIFHNGSAYDVSVGGSRIVIFDGQADRIVLLDKQRKIKTEVGTGDLEAARERLRSWCLKQADSVLRFCGKPAFEIKQSEGQLAFLASEMQYVVDTVEPADKQTAAEYRNFSDAMVGLAVIGQTSPVPPLARLAVNRELARRNVMPTSVAVEVRPQSDAVRRSMKIRSHHKIGFELRQKDIDLLGQILAYQRDFKRVHLNEFLGRKVTQAAAR